MPGYVSFIVRPMCVAIFAHCMVACGVADKPSEAVPASPKATIDPAFAPVAAEFSGRLAAIHGTLESLGVHDGAITVKWTSVHCEMADTEVIDFLVSLNRGHPGPLPGDIAGERTCDGSVRTFAATADRFAQYRAGRLNDAEILKGLR